MLMAALPTDLHLYSEAAGLVQHAQWCLWADPLTQSEQVGERPRRRVEHIAEYASLAVVWLAAGKCAELLFVRVQGQVQPRLTAGCRSCLAAALAATSRAALLLWNFSGRE